MAFIYIAMAWMAGLALLVLSDFATAEELLKPWVKRSHQVLNGAHMVGISAQQIKALEERASAPALERARQERSGVLKDGKLFPAGDGTGAISAIGAEGKALSHAQLWFSTGMHNPAFPHC